MTYLVAKLDKYKFHDCIHAQGLTMYHHSNF